MPDTTPGKSGTRRTTPAASPEPPVEPASPATEETPPVEPAPEAAPDTSGWYRNDAAVALLVMPVGYPSAQLKPGDAVWLPADPQHPDLRPCDAPDAAAADTTGSEQ